MINFMCISVLSGSFFPYVARATEGEENSSTVVEKVKDIESSLQSENSEAVEEKSADEFVNNENPKSEVHIESGEEITEQNKETEQFSSDKNLPKEDIESLEVEESDEPESTQQKQLVEESAPVEETFSLKENREKAWEAFTDETAPQKNRLMLFSTRAVSATETFIAEVGTFAQSVAAKNGLYASVMIAQAALESNWGRSSLASYPNYNLFGIKGSYNGQSVRMKTSEWSESKGWYNIYTDFRKYPSFTESFQDNANLLRNGVSYNKSIYSGAWLENTTSYTQATDHLEGIYATDPSYNTKLNTIIEQYDLTRFDNFDSVKSSNKNNYIAVVNYSNPEIYTRPKGMYNARKVSTNSINQGDSLEVKQEMRTQSGVFAKVYKSSGDFLGWINKKDIRVYDSNLGSKSKDYINRITPNFSGIYTKPYNLEGSKKISDSSDYTSKYVQIKQEMKTQSGLYGKAYINNKFVGWILVDELSYDTRLKSIPKNYTATVSANLTGIYTKPFNLEGAQIISNYSSYVGKEINIVQEMKTESGTYGKANYNGSFIGWVKTDEIKAYDTNLNSYPKNYFATISSKSNKIYTKPYNMKGSTVVENAGEYVNKDVQIKQEMKTQSGTYGKAYINNKFIGWVDVKNIKYDTNLDSTQMNYSATIKSKNDSIYTKPKFFKDSSKISNSTRYTNQSVQVKQVMKTAHGVYAKISQNNKVIGWILKEDLK